MSGIHNIVFTTEAANEFRALPDAHKAWITDKLQHVRAVGWIQALQLQLIKKLKGADGIYEIIIKGKGPSYRLFCFPSASEQGTIVVTTSCEEKKFLLGQRRMKQAITRAENRRDNWLYKKGGF